MSDDLYQLIDKMMVESLGLQEEERAVVLRLTEESRARARSAE